MCVYLLRLQVTDDGVDAIENLLYKWHHLSDLHQNKMPSAFLCYFYEGVASHVLHSVMCFCKTTGGN